MSKFSETGVIIRENTSQALGALAATAAIKVDPDAVMEEDFRMLKSEIFAQIEGLTAGEGVQLLFGIANGELTATEIGECLNTDGPVDRNDRANKEMAERFVKVLGMFTGDQGNQAIATEKTINTDGRPLIVKPRWTFSNPEGWAFFVYNQGADVLTTNATVRVIATNYGVWVT